MNGGSPTLATGTDCWNRIGIAGDRSCSELPQVIQCRNCPVFGSAARAFFGRRAPAGYLEEWTRLLAIPDVPPRSDGESVLIFRLGAEWLAIRTRVVVEVTTMRPFHRIPHRSGTNLVGMVNLRGQLHLLISLHGLLGVEESNAPTPADHDGARDSRRLVVIRKNGQDWVFAAEDVHGVKTFSRDDLRAVPSDLANPTFSFSQAVIRWEGHSVGFLDELRVFGTLEGIGQ